MDQPLTKGPGYVRPRYVRGTGPHALRDWFARHPEITRARFADLIGCTNSYVTQLCADNGPWPGRVIGRRIAEVTKGEVTPNMLAGYQPD